MKDERTPMNDPFPYTDPQAGKRHTRLVAVALVTGVLAAGLVGAAWFLKKEGATVAPTAIPAGARALTVVGPAPTAPAYEAGDAAWNAAALPGVDGAQVIGMASGQLGTYAIAVPVNETAPQVFLLRTGSAAAERLTDSPTYKFRLSTDPFSGDVAFLAMPYESASASAQQNPVTLVRLRDGAESAIAIALSGIILPNRQGALLVRSDGLYLLPEGGSEAERLFDIAPTAPYAASTDGSRFAYLNPRTDTVDEFDVTNGIRNASYLRSIVPSTSEPQALAYWGDELVAGSFSLAGEPIRIENLANGLVSSLPAPAAQQGRLWEISFLPHHP